jgi:lipopolysaccharide biosynthesis regulator YciM
MSVRIFLFCILLVFSVTILFAHHNRGSVSVHLPPLGTHDVPLTVLVVVPLLLGVLTTLLLATFYDLQQTLSRYRESREARRKERIGEIYAQGMNSLLARKWSQAKTLFRHILTKDPQYLPAFLRLGEISLQEGDYSEAIRWHLKASSLDPDNLEVLLNLARDYEQAGQMEEAIRTLERIAAHFKDNLEARQRLQSLYVRSGRWDKALGVQKELWKLSGGGSESDSQRRTLLGYQYQIGVTKLEKGEFKEAAKIFREVAKSDKRFLPAYVRLGDTYYRRGEKMKAARIWERAFDITRSSIFLERLEQVYLESEAPQRLLSFYHQRTMRFPGDLMLHLYLGKLYYRLEMLDEAAEQFRRLIREIPDFTLPHYLLAQIRERRRAWAEAMAHYKNVVALSSQPLFPYRCSQCGFQHREWRDRCTQCGGWGTVTEEIKAWSQPPQSATLHTPIRF